MEEILPLMAYVLEEVERKKLPGEFALLPIVESWYRPAAIGPGGPAGMWQMISSTARNHGIRIQSGYDGRLSPVESTDAALSYLQTLDGLFDGEWRAMAMAYNAGEYRIIRAFRASGDRRVSGESQLPRGRHEHANRGEGRKMAHGGKIRPPYHPRRRLCWRAPVLRRIFRMVQRRSRNMNADFESNAYALHHQSLSHAIRRND